MRKWLVILLLGAGTTALPVRPARAGLGVDQGENLPTKMVKGVRASTSKSRAALPGVLSGTGDTTYVGFTPGHSSDNYWSIWSGSNQSSPPGPYHRPAQRGAMWDFESPVGGDSLEGWWSYRNQMTGTGGLTIPDEQRPWRALDYGNNANYVFGAGKTFGVTGVWHVDGGNSVSVSAIDPGSGTLTTSDPQLRSLTPNFVNSTTGVALETDGGVKWGPLEGAGSAWMGLRRHGDTSYIDPITGNPYNEDVLQFNFNNSTSAGGSDKRFPGYGAQMDQILYRDVDVPAGATRLDITFSYRTAMSTAFVTSSSTRTGWFQNDPLTVTVGGAAPNFIQNNASVTNPPADSLMVYVGAPAEGSVILSDGATHAIFDPLRRWFGEVVRSNEGLCKQVFSKAGTNAASTVTVGLDGTDLANILAASGNRARLAFRVKTNQSFDDETNQVTGYSSSGVGAAIVDAVTLSTNLGSLAFAGPVGGSFNHAGDIDNDPNVSAVDAWKSTGKPPQPFHHVHALSTLRYEDINGQPGSATRICDMLGQVVSAGDHDHGERSGGTFGTAEQEPFQGIISPVINLATTHASSAENNMGLSEDETITADAGDYMIDYEIYTGIFDAFNQGNFWRFGFQSYPASNSTAPSNAAGAGQHERWGEVRFPGALFFNPTKDCFRDLEGVRAFGIMRSTNLSGIPDSCRIYVGTRQEVYRFGIPTSTFTDGAYWDNISLAIVDGPTPHTVTIDARELSDPKFRIARTARLVSGTCLTGLQTLDIGEGTNYYQGCDLGGNFAFDIDANGHFAYSPAYAGFLDGAGTNTLVIHGYPIGIDARPSPTNNYNLGTGPCFASTAVQSLRLVPGPYDFDACPGGSCPVTHAMTFGVDGTGNITYDPLLEGPFGGAGTTTLVVNSFTFPPAGDDDALSVGIFRIVVEPAFWDLMVDYPGYANVNGLHRLVSPTLIDFHTIIGRSAVHRHGDAADVGGTPVGLAGTIVKDSDFALEPPGFQGPAGTLEVHTAVHSLNLKGGGIVVRAGVKAPNHPLSPISPGEIEAASNTGGLFPGDSFFNVYVEADLPLLGTLYNTEPLLVENSGITCFPPEVVYMHRHTGPVPMAFKSDDTMGRWHAGDRFGWLVLAGHGYNFDTLGTAAALAAPGSGGTRTLTAPFAAFEDLVNSEPEMADTATVVVDLHDVLTFSPPAAYAQPADRDSLTAGLDAAAALGQAGDPCGGIVLLQRMHERVDGIDPPLDWVTDSTVRRVFLDRIDAMWVQFQTIANQHGGCQPTAVPPAKTPERVAIVGIQPNPSFGTTTIRYAMPAAGRVTLSIYDATGRLVRGLVDAEMPAGTRVAVWDGCRDRAGGRPASSGAYFVRLRAGGVTQMKRMVVVK